MHTNQHSITTMAQANSDNSTVLERVTEKTKQPPKFNVILHNDDFTPMEFVVNVLVGVFMLSTEKAEAIMMTVHKSGKAIAGTYSHDVASTRVLQVTSYAQQFQHPLKCTFEPAPE